MTLEDVPPAVRTQAAYQHFSLREWKIIADALKARAPYVGYFETAGVYVSSVELFDLLAKCSSAAL